MAKRTPAKDQDKFIVRLPEGMRDRIKVKADRAHMSMNEAVVWVLERHFPAPATLEDRIDSLARSVAALKRGNDLEADVDNLVDEIDTTLREIYVGRVKTSDAFKKRVTTLIEEWDEAEAEQQNEENYDPFDDANYTSYGHHLPKGDPFKSG